jgi:hypothetical protein
MVYFIVSVVTPYRKISHKHKGHKNTITSYSGWISLAVHLSKRNKRTPAVHKEDIQQPHNLHYRKWYSTLTRVMILRS